MAPSGKTPSPIKRLMHEFQDYQSDPNTALQSLGPVSDDELLHWSAIMRGVNGTPYEGGLWKLDIKIPSNYPLSPPEIKFVTPICHPNVNFQTGEICLDLLKTHWAATYTISSTLTCVHQLLTDAEPESPLNIDVALLYRQGDRLGAESLIRYYTDTMRWQGR